MKLLSLIIAVFAVLGVGYMTIAAPSQTEIASISHSR
jgi:hypothetical protein